MFSAIEKAQTPQHTLANLENHLQVFQALTMDSKPSLTPAAEVFEQRKSVGLDVIEAKGLLRAN